VIRYNHGLEPNGGNGAMPGVSNVVMSAPSMRGRKVLTMHPRTRMRK
jgi:hypothetical protein